MSYNLKAVVCIKYTQYYEKRMLMDGYSRIQSMLECFTESERKIATYLLNTGESSRNLTSAGIAQKINVGQSSVVKFAQKLGYEGFSDFKLALWGEAVVDKNQGESIIHSSISVHDSLSVVARKLVFEKCDVLEKTLLLNNEARLMQGVHMINQANRILLVGIGASGLVAQDFCYKLLKIGKSVSYQQDAHVQLASAQALSPGDLLLAISLSGALREVNQCAIEAKANGANCLVITSINKNKLHELADHALYVLSKERSIRSSAMTSRIAQMSLIDILFVGLIQLEPQLAAHYIQHSRELIEGLK